MKFAIYLFEEDEPYVIEANSLSDLETKIANYFRVTTPKISKIKPFNKDYFII